MEQLQQVLSELGLAWETNAQVGWRLHWLESVEFVAAQNGKYQMVQPKPEEAQPSTPLPEHVVKRRGDLAGGTLTSCARSPRRARCRTGIVSIHQSRHAHHPRDAMRLESAAAIRGS